MLASDRDLDLHAAIRIAAVNLGGELVRNLAVGVNGARAGWDRHQNDVGSGCLGGIEQWREITRGELASLGGWDLERIGDPPDFDFLRRERPRPNRDRPQQTTEEHRSGATTWPAPRLAADHQRFGVAPAGGSPRAGGPSRERCCPDTRRGSRPTVAPRWRVWRGRDTRSSRPKRKACPTRR